MPGAALYMAALERGRVYLPVIGRNGRSQTRFNASEGTKRADVPRVSRQRRTEELRESVEMRREEESGRSPGASWRASRSRGYRVTK
jgi:hypothetical protein